MNLAISNVLDLAVGLSLLAGALRMFGDSKAIGAAVVLVVLCGLYALATQYNLAMASQVIPVFLVATVLAWIVTSQRNIADGFERIAAAIAKPFIFLIDPANGSADAINSAALSIAAAAEAIRDNGRGALIVIERRVGLGELADEGLPFDAQVTAEMLYALFVHYSSLGYYASVSDRAVLVRGDRIVAAGVWLPSADLTAGLASFGSRHRAALGLTEQTDAVVVVVSEETGQISLVERVRVVRNLDRTRLERALRSLMADRGPTRGNTDRDPGPHNQLARRSASGEANAQTGTGTRRVSADRAQGSAEDEAPRG